VKKQKIKGVLSNTPFLKSKGQKMNNIKMIHGIDTLHYFCESNENYDNLFLDILDQMEDIRGKFGKREIDYENSDIYISIDQVSFSYRGKAEGFYWFKNINDFFQIGFKDKATNRGLNDIRVQLLGVGIYTIGIKSLIDFINKNLLANYITDYQQITRVDLNTFVQYDFKFITRDMFVTRKRNYSTIAEIGNSKEIQTIYIGKKPFLLRLYNKQLELKNSNKKDLMEEYFLNNGFDIDDNIFNIEFELHRTHLKQYNIKTVDELLQSAVKLFKTCMDDIRLIDTSTLSDDAIKHNNKNRAVTLPVWEHIKQSYNLKQFLQSSIPLDRVKRKVSIYDDRKFKIEMLAVLRRAFINNLVFEPEHLDFYYYEAKESLKKTTTTKEMKKVYEELPNYINEDGKKQKARILDDNTIIKPVNVVSVNTLNDYDLTMYLNKLSKNKGFSQHDYNLYSVAFNESKQRGLTKDNYD